LHEDIHTTTSVTNVPVLLKLPLLMVANVASDFLVTMVTFATIIRQLLWSRERFES
jgi:hypothetical protein